jgi:tetratricopeptide (TPR) repeat protein
MAAIFISHSTKDNDEADAMGVWLEEQGHKSYFIDYDEASGIRSGTDWKKVLYQRMRQCRAVIVLVSQHWLESKWCFAEAVLALEKDKPVFPVKLGSCELPDILNTTQSVDLGADREGAYRRLAIGLKECVDPASTFVLVTGRAPYPGFASFQEADAAVFFGRMTEILEVREALAGLRHYHQNAPRLLLILGSSGSGKSSLVRAGLIPQLKKDQTNWLPLQPFRPRANPLHEFGLAIENTYEDLGVPCDTNRLYAHLPDEGGLLAIAHELASAVGRREATVLITIDQAEELFTTCQTKEANAFLRFLGASLSIDDPHLIAMATLRSDSLAMLQDRIAALSDPAHQRGLKSLSITVQPIPVERYGDLIEEPAKQAGIVVDRDLVVALVRDAGQPDSLPLLAFMLRRLYALHFEWPNADQLAKFTVHDYETLGKLEGAVKDTADQILKQFALSEKEINTLREAVERPFSRAHPRPWGALRNALKEINTLRRAFIPGLVTANEERNYSRCRAFLDDLPPESHRLLRKFVEARLLVKGVDKRGRTTLEIAHEALLRTWPALTTWLIADGDKLRQHKAILHAAHEWNERHRKDAYLVHRDGRLEDATKLVLERRFAFRAGSVEQIYIDACEVSQCAREAAVREERERQLRYARQLAYAEAERAREAERAASKLRRLAIGTAGAAVAALILLVIAVFMWRAAQEQAQIATVQRLAAQSSEKEANHARDQADGLINFMLFDLRDKLQPIGRLDTLDDVVKKAKEYVDTLPKELVTSSRLRQRGVILGNLGDVLEAQGKLPEALEVYQQSLAIVKSLAVEDPSNVGWQQDLSVIYGKVGGVLAAQGKLPETLETYQQSLAIIKRLAEQDPSNAGWQRVLSVGYGNMGNVLEAQGKLPEALEAYQQTLAIIKRLAEQDPSNAGWQQDLSVGYNNVGVVLEAQGKLPEALDAYQQSSAIIKRLAEQDPSNAGWQRDLSVSYGKVGVVLEAQGKLPEALEAYQQTLAIIKRLAEKDPSNAGWQRDLSVSYGKVGGVLAAQGKLPEALEAYQQDLVIAKRLAEQDPSNAGWQRDLSVSYSNVGDVLEAQGKLPEALDAYQQSLNIRRPLAEKRPSKAEWQQDLSVSYGKVGEVLEGQGRLPEALEAYEQSLAIIKSLAEKDPSNTDWQRYLAVSYGKVGSVLEAQGKLPEALEAYQQTLAIFKRLAEQDPSNAGWQRDFSASYIKVGEVLEAQGKLPEALDAYQQGLAIIKRLAEQGPSNTDWQRVRIASLLKVAKIRAKIGGKDNVTEAQGLLRTALTLTEQYSGADRQHLLDVLNLTLQNLTIDESGRSDLHH